MHRVILLVCLPVSVLVVPLSNGSAAEYGMCHGDLAQNVSPPINSSNFPASRLKAVQVVPSSASPSGYSLRLDTNANKLDVTKPIILPFDQHLTAELIYDHAGEGASSTLGFLYYEDLLDLGFIDQHGTYVKCVPSDPAGCDPAKVSPNNSDNDTLILDKDGIPKLYKALFNLDPSRYWGPARGRRCPKAQFTYNYTDGSASKSVTLYVPELTIGDACSTDEGKVPETSRYYGGSTDFGAKDAATPIYVEKKGPRRWIGVGDYYPRPTWGGVVGYTFDEINPNILDPAVYNKAFSDQGLFPHIPNLLEPKDVANNNVGIGHLIFLETGDDWNLCTSSGSVSSPECLTPWLARDSSSDSDGVADYRTSAFDDRGQLKAGRSATEAIVPAQDREVDMGTVLGGKEIVFFFVAYVKQIYGPATDACLRMSTDPAHNSPAQCDLWLHSDINVLFSRSMLNLDLNQHRNPKPTNGTLKTVHLCDDSTSRTCTDWIDAASIKRIQTLDYHSVVLPPLSTPDVININLDNANPLQAVHFVVGAPSTDPLRWVLGIEDQNASGDETFNDATFLINKQNNGMVRSEVVSDIDLSAAAEFVISKVRFTRDDLVKNVLASHTGACDLSPLPEIDYFVAVDCKTCGSTCSSSSPTWTANPNPTWIPVSFGATYTPVPACKSNSSCTGTDRCNSDGSCTPNTAEIDLLQLGFAGSQLCWRATMASPNEYCQPQINNVSVAYQAQRSGDRAFAPISPIANAIVEGTEESVGATWYVGSNTSTRIYEAPYNPQKDLALRGHVYFKTLYDPENPKLDNLQTRWDAGAVLKNAVSGAADKKLGRTLYSMDSSGKRVEVMDAFETNLGGCDSSHGDLLACLAYPNRLCDLPSLSAPRLPTVPKLYDLNSNGGSCNCPSSGSEDCGSSSSERCYLARWLYGWEDKSTSFRRAWPLGAIDKSSSAVIAQPAFPSWYNGVSLDEQLRYKTNFMQASDIASRRVVTYVGTTTGYLEALDSGLYASGDDPSTEASEQRGYFVKSGSARDYGSGKELWAYLPRKMMPRYVNDYIRDPTAPFPSVNGSPSVADVDLGFGDTKSGDWKPSSDRVDQGAKTVLVTGTGPLSSVFFALDITYAGKVEKWPIPMWELDPANDTFTIAGKTATIAGHFGAAGHAVPLPDYRGSRHSPPVARMDFGAYGTKWVAAMASDYKTTSGSNGTVYLVDVKTGMPVSFGTSASESLAGVVTLGDTSLAGEGVGGEVAAVDVDQDGTVDVLYVPSTSGKVFRLNLRNVSTKNDLGRVVPSCVVADAPADTVSVDRTNAPYQRIYSSMSVKLVSADTTKVQLYFGTANNPDSVIDAEDTASGSKTHYVFAYEDADPLGSHKRCDASLLWRKALDANQVVWGGVTVNKDSVFTATAVGKGTDPCALSSTTSGQFYALQQSDGAVTAKVSIGGHAVSAPVLHDQHIFLTTATGEGKVIGPANTWNNPVSASPDKPPRKLIWTVLPNGKLPR